jgi:hypothetical protein
LLQSKANPASAHHAEELADFDPLHPEALAFSIDRQISLMQRLSADPRLDMSKSMAERAMHMEEPPAARASVCSLGPLPPASAIRRASLPNVAEWLPYSSTKEKLAKWVEPRTNNDAGDQRNFYKQMSMNERSGGASSK